MITEILTTLNKYKETNRQLNEENTKMTLVVPLMEYLGYNPRNIDELESEYIADIRGNSNEKVDYAIMKDGKPFIFIEVKPLGTTLEKHIGQLKSYFTSSNTVRYGILTDGQKYLFFTDDNRDNVMDEESFYKLDLLNLAETDEEFLYLYTKESIKDEQKLENNRKTFKLKTFIEKHIKDPDDDFVEYISKRIGIDVVKRDISDLLYRDRIKETIEVDNKNYKEELDTRETKIKYPIELSMSHTRNNINVKAHADYFENKDTILKKGSQIQRTEADSIPNCTKIAREELVIKNMVIDKGNYYELIEDIICGTPSEASCIVIGGSCSGTGVFKVIETNKPLGEYLKETNS